MSWIRIWIHLIFSTKNNEPLLLTRELRQEVFQHIKQRAEEKDIWLDTVNGYNNSMYSRAIRCGALDTNLQSR